MFDSRRASLKLASPVAPFPSFTSIQVKPLTTKPVSSLSLLFQSHSTKAPAPFSSYEQVIPPVGAPSLSLALYFPHSTQPSKPIKTLVRKDATVEEVVGLGLSLYGDNGRKPELAEGLEEGRERDIALSTVGWGLRIVEDDGEVDEDFPGMSQV